MIQRLRIDPFAFGLGALLLLTAAFFTRSNGAALVMCGLCLAGLLGARLAGFSDRALVPLAFGLVVLLWIVWVDPPASSHKTSALAHFVGGALVGWALAEYLRARLARHLWAPVAVVCVLGLTIGWEIGEWLGDRVLDTALIPSRGDSAQDVFFGTAGGGLAVALAWLVAPGRRPG